MGVPGCGWLHLKFIICITSLLHRRLQLGSEVGVDITGVGVGTCDEATHKHCPHGCWARTSLSERSAVVDANTSAVVGPWLDVATGCGCGPDPIITVPVSSETCDPHTCLNGGRCIPSQGSPRCVCPYGTWGSQCKILTRHFEGHDEGGGVGIGSGGWAWLPSLPSCTEVHITLEVLTQAGEATLLYSGPDHLHPGPQDDPQDVVVLELRGGQPFLLLDLGAGPVVITLNTTYSLADNTWHRIDLIWKDELVEVIVDLCSGATLDTQPSTSPKFPSHNTSATTTPVLPSPPDAHTCRGAARLPRGARMLNTEHPLQVGGLAHPIPSHIVHGWPISLLTRPLHGCIRNLRVNSKLMDLGDEVLSHHSSPGCPSIDCSSNSLTCGPHGRCDGSPGQVRCECEAGWAGEECRDPTTPAAFQVNSYVKLALSFTPLAYTTSLRLRFRTWRRRGELVVLSSQHGRDRLGIQLVRGQLCLVLQLHPTPPRSLCLTRATLTDGQWHSVTAERHGSATILAADDGEGDLYNASLSLEGRQLLDVDKQEGVHVGGSPEYLGVSVFKIHGDFHEGCIDDVRVSGRRVPLPPAVNSTPWGQASLFQGVEEGCNAPSACTNVTCRTPLTCVDTWRSYHCGCGEGRVLARDTNTCQDADECLWEPCLNGGTCFNKHAGYACSCPPGFSGQHCHLPDVGDTSLKISLGALVAILVWCTFLLLLVCAFLLHQHQNRSAMRRALAEVKENSINGKAAPPSPCSRAPSLLELQLLKPPRANGQPAWVKNSNIADVDVLQVDASSTTCSPQNQKSGRGSRRGSRGADKGNGSNGTGKPGANTPAEDDLRNYAYEGEGSSPGSLSSCLESCSGSAKLLGGFREVAHMLESWDPTGSHSSYSPASTKSKAATANTEQQPITTIPCDIHNVNGVSGDGGCHDPLAPPTTTFLPSGPGTPMPMPDPPRAFNIK
ncbi:hypothetical protein Pmani_030755 [Petrolisthes manimaculis]|uniref:Uncharacterized protein n=1 Tax=Petrolisthes manimaculis TaxID=1843537 RepID=A0AAE1NX64_9EUCA|nr:hypothetical protein Pmani_030755 [Petrolisthes manimaculis]